jgi:hypothetical protein
MKRRRVNSFPVDIIVYISSFLTSKIDLWKTSKAINLALSSQLIFDVDQITRCTWIKDNFKKLQIANKFYSKIITIDMKELHIVDNEYQLRYMYMDEFKCTYVPNGYGTRTQRTNDALDIGTDIVFDDARVILQIHFHLKNLKLLSIYNPLCILSDVNLKYIPIQTLILKHRNIAGLDFFQKCTNVKVLEVCLPLYIKFQDLQCCQDLTQLTLNIIDYENPILDLQDNAEQVTIRGIYELQIGKLPQNLIYLNLENAYNCKIMTHLPISLQVLKMVRLKSKMLQKISQSRLLHLSFKTITITIESFGLLSLPLSLQSLTVSKKLLSSLNLDHCKYETYHQKLDDAQCLFQCNQKNWNYEIKMK